MWLHGQHCHAANQRIMVQVVEFVDFKERLEQSHAVAGADAEAGAAAAAASQSTSTMSRNAGNAVSEPSTSTEAPRLRFNEDLSTRPAWLPPGCGEVRFAMAEWWQQHSSSAVPGASLTPQLIPDKLLL